MSKEPELANKADQAKSAKPLKEKSKRVSLDISGLRHALVNYLVPLICVAASVLIVMFILMPSYKELPELKLKLEKNTQLEGNLRRKLANLNDLVDFKGVVGENSNLVNKVLVSEELVPGLLTQVDRVATEAGLTVNSLNYGLGSSKSKSEQTAKTVTYNVVTVNLDTTGSFAQLKTFMSSLEKSARLIIVDNYRYSRNETAEGERLGMNFVLISPYLFVESDAITDDSIDLDISDEKFQALINKIKSLKYYDPYEIDASLPVVETPPAEEGGTPPASSPPAAAAPASETLSGQGGAAPTP